MNTGVIDNFTEVFTRYIDSGFGLLGGEVAYRRQHSSSSTSPWPVSSGPRVRTKT